MKRLFLYLIAGIAMLLTSCSDSSSGPDDEVAVDSTEEKILETVRVMAYNIHHANPPSKPDFIDTAAIAHVIREADPDLVALQEIDAYTGRSGPFNEAEEIAKHLNMQFFFGKAINYDGGEYGVAILSKYPLSQTVVNKLPTQSGTNGEPRVLATARVTLPGGSVIRFGSTHLDAQSASTNRQLQAQKIVDIAQGEELPFIIAGDFNATPDSEVIGIVDGHFKRTCRLCPFTIPVNNPSKAIDFIAYHHPLKKFNVEDHTVINETYASDHLPVVANINILE